MSDLLITDVRVVNLDADAPASEPVDVCITDGTITHVGPHLPRTGETLAGDGSFIIPGLWDQHVHAGQWAEARTRLDLAGTHSAAEALDRIRDRIDELPAMALLQAYGHRCATWDVAPTAAMLDEVGDGRPIICISGDAHHGWLSSRAMDLLGLPRREGVVEEAEWFAAFSRLKDLPGTQEARAAAYPRMLQAAAACGIVGIVDFEWERGWQVWPTRHAQGMTDVRVRSGVYAADLDAAIADGLHSGLPLTTDGLVEMGPLKVITDGSLNTRTAFCCQPFTDRPDSYGVRNITPADLTNLLARAHTAGFVAALHAIGDCAVTTVLDSFAATGARGTVEHAQLLAWSDIPRFAELGIAASVQPHHLWDDREVADICWSDRTERSFAFRALADANVELRLGSDAPVSPLDPWLTIAAAVHRSANDGEPWHPEQALTPREALAASVDGQRIRPNARGDILLLDVNPLQDWESTVDAAAFLRTIRPRATVMDGRLTYHA